MYKLERRGIGLKVIRLWDYIKTAHMMLQVEEGVRFGLRQNSGVGLESFELEETSKLRWN